MNVNNNLEFNLPIFYIEKNYDLNDNLKKDLELSHEHNYELYKRIFDEPELNSNLFINNILHLYSCKYTSDANYLNDIKYFIKNLNIVSDNSINIGEIQNIYNDIQEINNTTDKDKNFINKYQYLEVFPALEFLNTNVIFLQCLSIYNILNPLTTIVIPILILLIPFFIILLRGQMISPVKYAEILLTILKNHPIGNAIKNYDNVGWDRKFFLSFSVVFYFFNIYQNTIASIKFYNNISKINYYLSTFKIFTSYSIKLIDNVNSYSKKSFQGFINKNNLIKQYLELFSNNLNEITFDAFNIFKIHTLGIKMKYFYELFKNPDYISVVKYCLFLESFKDTIICLQKKIKSKKMNFCKIVNKNNTIINGSYYCCIDKNNITNDINLKNNIIITGPNASGKTTILKSTLFNIILSQQFCCGFYKTAKIHPYNYLHSYINIPDTSQRDSLFQSEVRRCKYILDSIKNSNERHFCIFDELYSGTNPNEAISCAYSYLKYISKNNNCNFMLTTHFTSLCEKLNNHNNIINNKMNIIDDNYTYKMISGISHYKGGINILKQLLYPDEVIHDAENIIKQINI